MARKTTVFAGAAIVVAMRWLDRLMGLLSTLVLVRLLTPADFGVVAMATIVVGLIDVILDLGVHIALIQNRATTPEHFHTGWTIRAIQAAFAALIVFAASWPVADYYHDPRITAVMHVMAISVLIGGFENIGIVMFQKNMTFGRDFKFFFLKRLLGVVISIIAAFTLRSYWALIIGSLGSRLGGVALSYALHDFRPHFSLKKAAEIWSLSQWVLVKNIGSYVDARIDKLIVGRRFDATNMGAYTLADELAALPSTELLAPLGRVLFPAFVDARSDTSNLRRIFLLALGVQAVVGVPAAIGITLVARDAVLAVLGPAWVIAIPFVQVMGLVNALLCLVASAGYVLLALGKARTLSYCAWTQVVIFALLLFLPSQVAGAIWIAILRLIVVAASLAIYTYVTLREMPNLRLRDLLECCWRPLAATAAMAAVVMVVPLPDDLPALASLMAKVVIGAAVYVSAVFVLWNLARRPDGAERYVLQKLQNFRRRPR
jgi:O-antigen/teichoic acid export membrane protein